MIHSSYVKYSFTLDSNEQVCYEENFENTNRLIRSRIQRRTDNTKNNRKGTKTKGQAMFYKALDRRLKIEQHEPH